jgi:UDP:flavonoid glycosyltransferase YjiC (YdhE family)
LPNRFEFLKASDLVIARPGHGTITQSICYGKPLILVPTPNHTEQRNNARGAEKLGIAQIVHQEKLSYRSLLTCAEEALTSDHFVENAEHLRDKVSEYDGIEAATKIITFVAENQLK